MKQLINNLESNPKKIFLVDAFGAFVTAVLLSVVLVMLEEYIGIPPSTLYILAALPVLFIIYDLFSYSASESKTSSLLRGIAVLNLIYCCISIGFAFYHSKTITMLGWIYVINEVLIIIAVSMFELRVAKKTNKV